MNNALFQPDIKTLKRLIHGKASAIYGIDNVRPLILTADHLPASEKPLMEKS